MRRTVTLLAVATFALGASTLYVAHLLRDERSARIGTEAPVDASPAQLVQARQTNPAQPPQAAVPQPARASGTNPDSPAGPRPSGASSDEPQEFLRRRLAELSDPVRRAQRVAEVRAAMESSAEQIIALSGLQPHELERLLDFSAESIVNDQLRTTECMLAPDCDLQADSRTRSRSNLREMDRIIGPDAMHRMMARDARDKVNAFAGTLPDSHSLSPPAADQLVEAIVGARRYWLDHDAQAGDVEQQLQERAAAVLTRGQLSLLTDPHRHMFRMD